MRRSRQSHLHLQLGQEVIYLLLAAFGLLSLGLALVLSQKLGEITAEKQANILVTEKVAVLTDRVRALSDENERLRTRLALLGDKGGHSTQLAERLRGLEQQLRSLTSDNARLQQELRAAQNASAAILAEFNDKPPIINLKETEGFTFPLGEAALTPEFKTRLSSAVETLLDSAKPYKATVIEVIGHTDELPITGRQSNLDTQLIQFLNASRNLTLTHTPLVAADNTGLGMARAAAVAQFLMADRRLEGRFQILPMSGGQLITTNDTISNGADSREASQRRRIEIRARRSNY